MQVEFSSIRFYVHTCFTYTPRYTIFRYVSLILYKIYCKLYFVRSGHENVDCPIIALPVLTFVAPWDFINRHPVAFVGRVFDISEINFPENFPNADRYSLTVGQYCKRRASVMDNYFTRIYVFTLQFLSKWLHFF